MHKKINAILIPLIMLALLAAFFLAPSRDFSERENRYLAPLPRLSVRTVTDGSFMEDIADYVSDHFPLRDFFLGVNTRVGLARGKTLINGVYFAKDDYLIEKYEPSGNMTKIAKVVNNFSDKVEAKVTFMAVPTSAVINKDRLPAGTEKSADGQLEELRELLGALNCSAPDLTELLSERNEKTQVFYRLDHHWTYEGAKAAYGEYRRLQGETPKEFEAVTVSESFRGTLFNKVGECGLGFDSIVSPSLPAEFMENIDCRDGDGYPVLIFDKNKVWTADQYAYFTSGNHPFLKITNKAFEEGPDILIIKDSYANCMIPFMLGDYHTITVIDPRYYGDVVSAYANENGIEEVLFVYNMNMLGTDLGIRRVQ